MGRCRKAVIGRHLGHQDSLVAPQTNQVFVVVGANYGHRFRLQGVSVNSRNGDYLYIQVFHSVRWGVGAMPTVYRLPVAQMA